MVDVVNFYTFLFLFSNKMVIRVAGNHIMLVRKANREDPDQTASSSSLIWVWPVCLGFCGRQQQDIYHNCMVLQEFMNINLTYMWRRVGRVG